jgi:hypothetical protein
VSAVAAALLAICCGAATPASAPQVMVQVSGARIRASVGGAIVDTVGLGTVLTLVGVNGDDAHVRSAAGKDGWTAVSFLLPYDAADPDATLLDVARVRLQMKSGLSAEETDVAGMSRAELLDFLAFLGRAGEAAHSDDTRARLGLQRLHVLQAGLHVIAPDGGTLPGDLAPLTYVDYAQGRRVRPDAFASLADRFRKSELGETLELARYHAGLGGECEGDPGCIVNRALQLAGRYLARFPHGLGRTEVLREVRRDIEWLVGTPSSEAAVSRAQLAEMPKQDQAILRQGLEALTARVSGSAPCAERAPTLAALGKLAAMLP